MTADDIVNGLHVAADVLRNGHAPAAWRMVESLLPELRRIALAKPEAVADALARTDWNVSGGEK